MTQHEFNLCLSAIRENKYKLTYHRDLLGQCGAAFPRAFIDAALEVFNRFEERLSGEPLSPEVGEGPSSRAPVRPDKP